MPDVCEHGVPLVDYCRTCEQVMPPASAEEDAAWATALREHTRLTTLDKPFTCSCEPHVSDASQSWTDHMIAVYARVIPSGEPCRECGPGYRIGDEGCRHIPPGKTACERCLRLGCRGECATAFSPAVTEESDRD